MSNYATKSDLKNAACFDTSDFAKKDDLASIKSNIDKLNIDILGKVSSGLNCSKSKVDRSDVDKLKPVPIDIKKLSKKNIICKEIIFEILLHVFVKIVNI